jgi:hypothetical protein
MLTRESGSFPTGRYSGMKKAVDLARVNDDIGSETAYY